MGILLDMMRNEHAFEYETNVEQFLRDFYDPTTVVMKQLLTYNMSGLSP